jgi:signal peptidase II
VPNAAERSERPVRWPVFVGLAASVVVVDQLTKAWVVGRLQPGESIGVVDDVLRIVHGRNTGALFGLFRDQAPLFALASVAVVVLIVAYEARAGRSLLVTLALGLLLGGAIGNLVDRVRLGYVVDFIDGGIGDLRFYTFNVADSAVTGAILLLLLLAVRGERSSDDVAAAPVADGSAARHVPDGER